LERARAEREAPMNGFEQRQKAMALVFSEAFDGCLKHMCIFIYMCVCVMYILASMCARTCMCMCMYLRISFAEGIDELMAKTSPGSVALK
jgi:hypothetical protein